MTSIGVITLFPESFEILKYGLTGRAFKEGKIELFCENLRDHGEGVHKVVDDVPYGGGDGMILKADPIEKALKSLIERIGQPLEKIRKVYMSPSGCLWTQAYAEKMHHELFDKGEALIILCGRYGGVDERVLEKYFPEKISVGPYILNGGETAAVCIIETLLRLQPGVLGNSESQIKDSFSSSSGVEAPSYTRPRVWGNKEVPEILLSGNHQKIEEFRENISKKLTKDWFSQTFMSLEEMNKKSGESL